MVAPIKSTFAWAHNAKSVQLAGSFTDWQPVDMVRVTDNHWTLQLDLHPGHYQYKFVVDGQWVHDPDLDYTENEVGSKNNVIHLKSDKVVEGKQVNQSGIEVERKFLVPENYDQLLLDHGYTSESEFDETLCDDYYDTTTTGDYLLMRKNHWLRQRNGDWELKYPVGGGGGGAAAAETQKSAIYHETSNVEDIAGKLRALGVTSDGDDVSDGVDLSDLSCQGRLSCYAHMETRRKCYKNNAGDVSVVIDSTDWGFTVGEVEILVERKEDVAEAAGRIEGIAKELDFGPLDLASLKTQAVC